jgi:hypothetical protein
MNPLAYRFHENRGYLQSKIHDDLHQTYFSILDSRYAISHPVKASHSIFTNRL